VLVGGGGFAVCSAPALMLLALLAPASRTAADRT